VRILVCGGRGYSDWPRVREVLDELAAKHSKFYKDAENWLPVDLTIIHGGAKGADSLADQWAAVNWTSLRVYEADWETHGRSAGPKRNQLMLEDGKPDLIVAFPGGRGTAHMVKIARDAGVPVMEVLP